ncbi:MAG: hypothetical protein ACR2NB_09470 [Solirubrobacteraceae bacterium]
MPAAAIVTILAAVVVVVVLAVFLLAVARVLGDVGRQLEAVIGAVGTIAEKTEPVDSAVRSINRDLESASDALGVLLERKVGVTGAAELIASVDPLPEGQQTAREPETGRLSGDELSEPGPGAEPSNLRRARRPTPGDEIPDR